VASADAAIAAARRLGHPFTLALSLVFAASAHQMLGDAAQAQRHAAEAVTLATAYSFPLMLAWGNAFLGWALVRGGQVEEGLGLLVRGLAGAEATGSDQFRPHLLGLAAEAHLDAGREGEAAALLREALRVAMHTGERFYEPALRRLEARLTGMA
jgi:predicted ATPase